VILRGFRHQPGTHCGSTALRDALAYRGLEVSEPFAFGLGGGLGFSLVEDDGRSPTLRLNGRRPGLEETAFAALGQRFSWARRWDPDAIRAQLDAGHPVIAVTDLGELPHYDGVHFPAHTVLVVGYEGEDFLLADTAFEDLQRVPESTLERALDALIEPYPTRYHWASVPSFDAAAASPDLGQALAATRDWMLQPPGELAGVAGIERLARTIARWPERPDWVWACRFAYQSLEKRGTGRGGFRFIYADFLDEIGRPGAAAGYRRCGALWTSVSAAIKEAFIDENPAALAAAARPLARLVDAEAHAAGLLRT